MDRDSDFVMASWGDGCDMDITCLGNDTVISLLKSWITPQN